MSLFTTIAHIAVGVAKGVLAFAQHIESVPAVSSELASTTTALKSATAAVGAAAEASLTSAADAALTPELGAAAPLVVDIGEQIAGSEFSHLESTSAAA